MVSYSAASLCKKPFSGKCPGLPACAFLMQELEGIKGLQMTLETL